MSEYFNELHANKSRIGKMNFDHLLERGILSDGLLGEFFPSKGKELKTICELNPDLHVITSKNGFWLNRYEPNGEMYYLGDGDDDPAFEFEFRMGTPQEFAESLEEYLDGCKRENREPMKLHVAIMTNLAMGLSGLEGVIQKKSSLKIKNGVN